jgi:hypothetical protein
MARPGNKYPLLPDLEKPHYLCNANDFYLGISIEPSGTPKGTWLAAAKRVVSPQNNTAPAPAATATEDQADTAHSTKKNNTCSYIYQT